MSATAVGGCARKLKFIQPEISVARISCLSSGSFRPKLGLFILSLVLIGLCILIVVPLVSTPSLITSPQKRLLQSSKMEIIHKDSVKAVSHANTEFTKKLYAELLKTVDEGNNVVMSPFSVSAVISMIYSGAKGATASQIKDGLALPDEGDLLTGYKEALAALVSNENFTLDAANKIYVQEGFELVESFLTKTSENFLAETTPTNFGDSENARAMINDFVEKKTNGKIKDLIKTGVLSALTRLVLVNAIYFKGDWNRKFDPKMTTKDKFHLTDGTTVDVDMMFQSAEFRAAHIEELDAVALNMPYKGDRVSMILVLPSTDLAKTEAGLQKFDLEAIRFGPPNKYEVHLPKFKIESSHDLEQPLKNVGLVDMFDEGKADFSGISEKVKLWVSAVVQKAFIEVNEEGAEAAAATAGIMMMRAALITPKFSCDRPFIYFIKDNLTGLILFAGRVANPLKN